MKEQVLRYKIQQTVIGNAPEHCGGIFVGGEIIKTSTEGAEYTRSYTQALQAKAETPLLIPADIEAGCGYAVSGLTQLPSMMGLGAVNDPDMAYHYGYITGKEARSVGINWAFAPVVDLNFNPRNPLVNIRAIGDDPEKAIPLLRRVVKGMQDGGIAACIKHFPGDGVDWRDQHHITTCNSLSLEDYMRCHGRVFQELAQEAYTVMVGHISLPCFQKEKLEGYYPPATLSQELMVDLLRHELGFRGLVVSDALGMGGFLGWNRSNEESEVLSFKNGCDMMLWPKEGFVENVLSAVENGFISERRVDEAFDRVQELKEKLGLLERNFATPLTPQETQQIKKQAEAMYRASLTLECDKNQQLPLGAEVKKVAIIPVGQVGTVPQCTQAAVDAFAARGVEAAVHTQLHHDQLRAIAGENDKVLFLLFAQPHHPAGPLDFFEWDASAMWASLAYGREKTIVAAFGSPYFKNQYFERANTFINAYSPDVQAVETAVAAMFGEFDFTGTSPVKL